jgi:hypothetical protein
MVPQVQDQLVALQPPVIVYSYVSPTETGSWPVKGHAIKGWIFCALTGIVAIHANNSHKRGVLFSRNQYRRFFIWEEDIWVIY